MTRPFTLCLVVLVVACLSYVGYREYQQHIEFKEFIAQVDSSATAELFPPKVVSRRAPPPPAVDLNAAVNFINHQKPGRTITTASGEKIKLSLSEFEIGKEIIRILPNGEMYSVYAPEGSLDNPAAWDIEPYEETLEGLDNLSVAEYPQGDTSPIDYHTDDVPVGEDPYIYGVKLMKAQAMGISIEEFEQKLASREIIIGSSYRVPLTPQTGSRLGEVGSQEKIPSTDMDVEPSEIPTEPFENHDNSESSDTVKRKSTHPPIQEYVKQEGTAKEIKGVEPNKLPFDSQGQLIDPYSAEERIPRLQEVQEPEHSQIKRTPPSPSVPQAPQDPNSEQ